MDFKKIFKFGLTFISICALTACEKDNNNEPSKPDADNPVKSVGIYVLNQGNFYSGIEGSLTVIDYNSEKSQLNVFQKANGRFLGSTPQCGVAYGSKIYLGIYDSNTIEIIDRSNYRSIKQIPLDGLSYPGSQPRSIVASRGKVYISMFDGYVARLDTLSLQIDASVKVGPNPETMALYNGKLYVPNSDGMNFPGPMGTTASEIDLNTFTVTRTFNVPENPTQFLASTNGLYLLCMGDYNEVNAKIYKINSDFSFIEIDEATIAEICGDYLCYVNDPFYGAGIADYKKYNLLTGEISEWEIEHPEYANGIYYDKAAQKICISSLKYYGGIWPSFELPGYVAVYDSNGIHLRDYECGSGTSFMFSNAE